MRFGRLRVLDLLQNTVDVVEGLGALVLRGVRDLLGDLAERLLVGPLVLGPPALGRVRGGGLRRRHAQAPRGQASSALAPLLTSTSSDSDPTSWLLRAGGGHRLLTAVDSNFASLTFNLI